MDRKPLEKQRKHPQQARSRATYAAILEAAAQLIETPEPSNFTANHIAEKAGVSIGSLYQYFPNKEAILLAIAQREETRRPGPAPNLQSEPDNSLRTGLRRYIQMLASQPRTRKSALQCVLKERGAAGIGAEADKAFAASGAYQGLSRTEQFILSRAIVGVVQAAVLEERDDLTSEAFEDGVVRLARALLPASAVTVD